MKPVDKTVNSEKPSTSTDFSLLWPQEHNAFNVDYFAVAC